MHQCASGGVVLRHVYTAHNLPIPVNRCGTPAYNHALAVAAIEAAFAPQGLQNLRQKNPSPQRFADAVIQGGGSGICDHYPGGSQAFQPCQHICNGVRGQGIQLGQLVRGKLAFFNQGVLLAPVYQYFAHPGAIGIEKNQRRQCNGHIGHGI